VNPSDLIDWLYPLAIAALILGGIIAVLNFYLSFIRVPLLLRLKREARWVSGFPLIGSILLVPVAGYFAVMWSPWLFASAMLLLALDTGGALWLIRLWIRERRGRRR
jgi:hypothetical protein